MELSSNKYIIYISVIILLLAHVDSQLLSRAGVNKEKMPWKSTFERDVSITGPQKISLNKFKEMMTGRLPHDYMQTELYLLKWLRTYKFNLKEAENQLLKHLRWREENNIDALRHDTFPEFKEYKYYTGTFDKAGQPTLYSSIHDVDFRKMIIQGLSERIRRYSDKMFDESCSDIIKASMIGFNITRGNLMVDLQGFNLIQHACPRCIAMLLQLLTVFQSNYPECIDTLYLLNTPAIAFPVIDILKGAAAAYMFDSSTLKIFGTSKVGNLQHLLLEFDRSELPVVLGGTKRYLK